MDDGGADGSISEVLCRFCVAKARGSNPRKKRSVPKVDATVLGQFTVVNESNECCNSCGHQMRKAQAMLSSGDDKKKGTKRKSATGAGTVPGAAGSVDNQQGPSDGAEGSLDAVEVSNSCSAILQRHKTSIDQGVKTSITNLVLGLLKPRDGDAANGGSHRVVSWRRRTDIYVALRPLTLALVVVAGEACPRARRAACDKREGGRSESESASEAAGGGEGSELFSRFLFVLGSRSYRNPTHRDMAARGAGDEAGQKGSQLK